MNLIEQAIKTLDAIAVGSGPSARLLVGVEIPSSCKIIGAGDVTKYLKVDYYAHGDIDHYIHIPKYTCIVYSTTEYNKHFPRKENFMLFPSGQGDWQHGCSSGGMAIAIACNLFNRVGIIGFDGYYWNGLKYDPDGDAGQRQVIRYFKDKGKELVSLMPLSIHNQDLKLFF